MLARLSFAVVSFVLPAAVVEGEPAGTRSPAELLACARDLLEGVALGTASATLAADLIVCTEADLDQVVLAVAAKRGGSSVVNEISVLTTWDFNSATNFVEIPPTSQYTGNNWLELTGPNATWDMPYSIPLTTPMVPGALGTPGQ